MRFRFRFPAWAWDFSSHDVVPVVLLVFSLLQFKPPTCKHRVVRPSSHKRIININPRKVSRRMTEHQFAALRSEVFSCVQETPRPHSSSSSSRSSRSSRSSSRWVRSVDRFILVHKFQGKSNPKNKHTTCGQHVVWCCIWKPRTKLHKRSSRSFVPAKKQTLAAPLASFSPTEGRFYQVEAGKQNLHDQEKRRRKILRNRFDA